MKKLFLFLSVLFLAPSAFGLDASISYAAFKAPEQPYVEIYLHVVGETLTFAEIDSLYKQGKVEVVILFKQGDKIVNFDKYTLESPLVKEPINFFDLKRFGLENGTYQLEVSVQDANDPENAKTYTKELVVDFNDFQVQQSDLQLLLSYKSSEENNSLAKNGLILETLPFNYYDKHTQQLLLYNEVYGSDVVLGEDFLVTYFIESIDGSGEAQTVLINHKRKKPAPVVVLLLQMDIGELVSGNYNMVVEIRNRNKELLSQKKVFFQRSNPYLNIERDDLTEADLEESFVELLTAEDLKYSLKALLPVLPSIEVDMLNYLIKEENLDAQRLYLFSHWAQKNPNRPDLAYQEYMKIVRAVDRSFKSGFGHGFETDRGYVFLKYGMPDDRFQELNDPVAPPYEIWSYNYLPQTRQNNIRFIFYNPSLAGGDFRLLHSNARGEVNNPQWELELYRDAPNELEGENFIDGTQMQDNFGRQARRRVRDF